MSNVLIILILSKGPIAGVYALANGGQGYSDGVEGMATWVSMSH